MKTIESIESATIIDLPEFDMPGPKLKRRYSVSTPHKHIYFNEVEMSLAKPKPYQFAYAKTSLQEYNATQLHLEQQY